MITVLLKDAMESYRQRTGKRMTYEILAEQTGLARATLESLGARDGYNTSLRTIDRICAALDCSPADVLGYQPNETPDA